MYLDCEGYDGASNIRREFNGLKTLILKEIHVLIMSIVLLINFNLLL